LNGKKIDMNARSSQNRAESRKNGFTVLEVIVAIFIFGCVSAAVLRAVAAGDRIKGRSIALRNAVTIASNEAERIRNNAVFYYELSDSSFRKTINGREFSVERRIYPVDTLPHSNASSLVEVEISVTSQGFGERPLQFRFLQGNL